VSLMCDSQNAVNPSGEPIESMTVLQVLVITNKVLGPKSQLTGKDRLVELLSLKPRDEENSVRHLWFSNQSIPCPDFPVYPSLPYRIVDSTALGSR
jgi:hypothetical protein